MYKIIKKLKTVKYGERFSVTSYKVGLPGNKSTVFYLRKSLPYAVIIPLIDSDTFLLIRQYRFGADKISLEFPMGMVKGKKPDDIARQELKEETGYTAKKLTLLASYYLSPAWSTQIGYLYIAKGLTAGKADPEPYEFIEPVPTKIKQMKRLIQNKTIFDASTILAYSYYDNICGNTAVNVQ